MTCSISLDPKNKNCYILVQVCFNYIVVSIKCPSVVVFFGSAFIVTNIFSMSVVSLFYILGLFRFILFSMASFIIQVHLFS